MYIFLVQTLYEIYALQILSPSLGLFCPFLELFLKEQMFLILIEFNLLILSFLDHVLCVKYKKSLPNSGSQRFSPVFSLRRFIGLCFTFRSRIHFGLIFVYAAKYESESAGTLIEISLTIYITWGELTF